jgi:hypothetical protein
MPVLPLAVDLSEWRCLPIGDEPAAAITAATATMRDPWLIDPHAARVG